MNSDIDTDEGVTGCAWPDRTNGWCRSLWLGMRSDVRGSSGRGSTPPVGTGAEVDRLRQVLEDVRFSLERGCWQEALAVTQAALTRGVPLAH